MKQTILAPVWKTAVVFTIWLSIFLTMSSSICAQTRDTRKAIFIFHTDEFWLNLHHFLYVLGRAENKERDTAREAVAGAPTDQAHGFEKLSAKEQTIWREAVASYAAGSSKRDLVFDDPLPALTNALARAGDAKSLTGSGVDTEIAAILQSAAPIYRKAWWKNHHDANRNWQKVVQSLVDRHGATVLTFITNKYQLSWPTAGFPVHVSGYSNWAGAYSTRGNLLVVSSQSPGLQGIYGLETIFHEGMHQWDDQVFQALREQARQVHKVAPRLVPFPDFLHCGRSCSTRGARAHPLCRKVWRMAARSDRDESRAGGDLEALSRGSWHSRQSICRTH